MCVFVFPQARDFLSFNGCCCVLIKRSAWKCCDLAPIACPNNESGHKYLGSQRQVGGMLLHSRWHRNWCRALKPKGKSVVLNPPKGSSLTLLIDNNKVWEKADISSCKTCLRKESWKKKKRLSFKATVYIYICNGFGVQRNHLVHHSICDLSQHHEASMNWQKTNAVDCINQTVLWAKKFVFFQRSLSSHWEILAFMSGATNFAVVLQ